MTENKHRVNLRNLIADGGIFLGVLCILAIGVAGFVPMHFRFIDVKVEELFRKAGADSCKVGRVDVVAWKSISCREVTFSGRIDSIRHYSVRCAKINLGCNVPTLLFHRKAIRNLKVSRSTEKTTQSLSQHFSRYFPALEVLGLRKGTTVTDFAMFWKQRGKEIVRCRNGILKFGSAERSGDRLTLTARIPFINIAGDGIQDLRCSVYSSSEGEITVPEISGSYFDGKVRSRVKLNLKEQRIDSYTCTVEKMDMAYWYAVHVGIGEITGKLDLQAEGKRLPLSMPPRGAELHGTLQNCRVSGLPVQRALATSLFIPSLSVISFDRLTADALIDTGDTVTARITGEGDQMTFSSDGWILTDGKLQQRFEGVFSKTLSDSFPPVVRKTLLPEGKGKRKFACRLYGTFHDPLFELDESLLRRAVGNMFEDLRQEIIDIHDGKK
ncbi:MAG: hypothetical protein JW863_12120 [Chitinispirillaceae bacterium]|nr:hypothetical protein [Chitinispirillaceae bacterium]